MFSELVDEAVSRSRRPDKQADIASYANQTLRELQSMKNGAFTKDLVETSVTVGPTDATPFIWSRPEHFRIMRAVAYQSYMGSVGRVWPKFLRIGKRQDEHDYYYYGAADYFVFAGVGGPTNNPRSGGLAQFGPITIELGYYVKFRRYQYYIIGLRPAVYSRDAESWSFNLVNIPDPPPDVSDIPSLLPPNNTFNTQQQYAIYLVSNWLLKDYYDTVLEGTLAKLFKSVGDARAPSSFALFKSMEDNLVADEAFESMALE